MTDKPAFISSCFALLTSSLHFLARCEVPIPVAPAFDVAAIGSNAFEGDGSTGESGALDNKDSCSDDESGADCSDDGWNSCDGGDDDSNDAGDSALVTLGGEGGGAPA